MSETRLRKPELKDKEQLAALANNKKIWDNVRDYFPSPYSEKNAEDFIKFCSQEDPPLTFVIEYKGETAGVAGLVKQGDVHRLTAEIGYWIGEPFWNKGIASEAVKQIVEYGFNVLKLERIYTGVFEFNTASQKVLEKCGFEREAIFKNAIIKNGRIVNEVRYGIIKNKTL